MKDYKHDLVWKLIDQDITESEMAELEVLFEEEPELRRYYQDCIETDIALGAHAAGQSGEAVPPLSKPGARRWHAVLLAGVAAVVAVIVAWIGFQSARPAAATMILSQAARFTPDRAVRTENRAYHVAYISYLENHGGTRRTWLPCNLTSGTVEIEQGKLELTYPSGTIITLRGPAEFDLISSHSGWLHRGGLQLEKGGTGHFEIFHSQGKVIDIGTAFAMRVDGNDSLDLYVNDGIVDVYDKNNLEVRRMVEGEFLSQQDRNVELKKMPVPPAWAGTHRASANAPQKAGAPEMKIQTATWLDGAQGTGRASGSLNGAGIRIEGSPRANGGGLFAIDWAQCIPALKKSDQWYHAESAAAGCAANARAKVVVKLDEELVDPILLFGWGEGAMPIDLAGLPLKPGRFFPANETIKLANDGDTIDFGNRAELQNRPCQSAAIQLDGRFGPDTPIIFHLVNRQATAESVAFSLGVTEEPVEN